MKKFFNKVSIVLIALLCVLLTACQFHSKDTQKEYQSELQEPPLEEFNMTLQVEEAKQELIETTIEQPFQEETAEGVTNSDLELPNDVPIIEISRNYTDNQEAITLKDGLLQLWINENMICEKQIPIPARESIGEGFYEVIGNPYISYDGRLVLIQSYTTSEGEKELDYTILAKSCNKIVPSLNYNGYVFQNNKGKYGLVFYDDETPIPGYPYEGFEFETVDSDFALPKPTIIWLNESTVKSVNFGSWGSASYGYRDVSGISVRLDVEGYGELNIAHVCDSFTPVEVDYKFLDFLHEKFTPEEYNERFSKLVKTINEYKQKG